MKNNLLLEKTEIFAKLVLKEAEKGHDYSHGQRVRRMVKIIAENENLKNSFVVEIAAIVHDIADHKFVSEKNNGIEVIKRFFYE
ncbi:MAG: HD domain-containing protein [Bacteroidales bacterium]|nr:HD domain-containing protein [Bacteroidales bacterium]